MKTWISLLLLLCSLVTAQAAEQLTISTNNTPLDRKVLQQLTEEAFRRLGRTVLIISLPSERSLISANLGEVDGEGLRVAGLSQQYPNLIQVPESYTRISFVAFSRDANITLEQGWASLRPYNVAFINGWKMFESHTGTAKSVQKVDKPEQIFQMLDSGRVDLGLYTKADGVAMIKSMGLPHIAPLYPSLKDVDMYLYVHKRHQSWVPQLAQTLKEMKSDGTYNRILSTIHASP